MDGDGSIQVNHWRKKYLQYRLVIKLKYCPENFFMLNVIKKNIGGKVKIHKNNILWVVDSLKDILNIIQIFNYYPPMTSRLAAQLSFMHNCYMQKDVDWYLNNRNKKYDIRKSFININSIYFKEWLSGFIEAEGCFSIRRLGNHSFSIGQKDDKYLIEFIKKIFNIQSQVRNPVNKFWVVETYRKSTLIDILNHCKTYPLLGEKILSLKKLESSFY